MHYGVSKHHGGYIITDGFGKNVVDTIPKVEENPCPSQKSSGFRAGRSGSRSRLWNDPC